VVEPGEIVHRPAMISARLTSGSRD
jgi:hypothetical protein